MRNRFLVFAFLFLTDLGRANSPLVDIKKYDFSFVVEMPYASAKNITGKKWYGESRCLLRVEVVDALLRVQKIFQLSGSRLKLLECYIPETVLQKILLEKRKYSSIGAAERQFSRGNTIAITYVDKQEQEVSMPFPGYQKTNEKMKDAFARKIARSHASFLKSQMEKEGFQCLSEAEGIYSYRTGAEVNSLDINWDQVP